MLTKLIIPSNYKPKNRKSSDGYFITVAGNVGAGKSTFTKLIGEKLNFNTSFEKVDDNPYLEDFYQDQARWGFHLQLYFLSQRFQDQKAIGEANEDHIQDRSIYEDAEIFAKSLYDNGKMSQRDFETYSELFYAMMNPYLVRPDLMVYLDGSVDTIIERIHQRGRDMEKKVPREYWLNLHNRYEKWLKEYKESPILTVNINQVDLVENPEQIDAIAREIEYLKNGKIENLQQVR
ncbi:deoxynucleoside kinase [Isachenkonia alkalipeptolytica]|uniref:Deoxynucleoside kinase n=1 Tax=Isachenkonia alkalipeptolytica TaxID=2565777 RepID=A0AA43XMH3_9CLOT|nr:deoxynucleoside kinase [Isachenkonia alkalipeptolytica]